MTITSTLADQRVGRPGPVSLPGPPGQPGDAVVVASAYGVRPDASAGSAMGRLTLAFTDPRLEREFRAEYARKSLPQVRFSLLMATLLYSAFGLLDGSIVPDVQQTAWIIRYGIFCPFALGAFGLSFSHHFVHKQQAILVLLGLLAAAGILAIIVLARPPGSYLYYAGLLMTCSAILTFMRLRFAIATPTAWLVVAMYEAAALTLTETPMEIVTSNSFFLVGLNVIGMTACYAMERYARTDFIDRARIEEKSRQIDDLRRQAEFLSRHDYLTSLPNRRYFYEILGEHSIQYVEGYRLCSVIMVDIDHFKHINDRHGHRVGDVALREVAHSLRLGVRSGDLVCRYGGEEFLVFLPETGATEAAHVAERIRAQLAEAAIPTGRSSIRLTVSAGVATADNALEKIDRLIERADAALYRSKQLGRNRVVAWSPEDATPASS